jgi:plastocyanin
MLKRILFFGIVLFGGALFAKETKVVVMKSISYDPKILEIHVGEEVEWKNESYTQHSASAEDKSFETGLISPKKTTKKILFDKPGTFRYHCSVHGKTMSGDIVVKP